MKSWEIEIKILADDFGLPRSLVKSAIKKAKDKVVQEFYNGNEENFRNDEAQRLKMPYILVIKGGE